MHSDVVRLGLQGLAEILDGLLGLVAVLVDLPENLIGPGGIGLELERRAQHLGRLVGFSCQQQVCAALDVGFEVPGIQAEVQVPDAGRVAMLLELAVDASQVQQRVPVARAQPSHLFVLRSRLADGALGLGAHRLDLVELGEDQVRIGIFGAQPDGLPGLASGLLEASHLAIEPGRFHADGGRCRIQLLGAAQTPRAPCRCPR